LLICSHQIVLYGAELIFSIPNFNQRSAILVMANLYPNLLTKKYPHPSSSVNGKRKGEGLGVEWEEGNAPVKLRTPTTANKTNTTPKPIIIFFPTDMFFISAHLLPSLFHCSSYPCSSLSKEIMGKSIYAALSKMVISSVLSTLSMSSKIFTPPFIFAIPRI